MTEQLIKLNLIVDNPYQPRIIDDAEHIEKLARNIAAEGLLQKPTVRRFGKNGDGLYQLAFGHSRRKAFEWLNAHWKVQGLTDRYDGYTLMPVEVDELRDEEMYRRAISENVQRKDLNPIEIAQAMIKYRDQFGKTSDEIGALFGMSGSTVRGKLRLLDLPEKIQNQLQNGEISEGAGRLAVTVARMAPENLDEMIDNIVHHELMPDDAAAYALSNCKKAKNIPDEWLKIKSFKHLPELKAGEVSSSFEGVENKDAILDAMNKMAEKNVTAETDIEKRVLHFLKPPACTACDFFATVAGTNYCSMLACFDRKAIAYGQAQLLKEHETTGVAIYDKDIDGASIELNTWSDAHKKYAKERHADLRIHPGETWHSFDGFSKSVKVVAVGKLYEKIKKSQKPERGTNTISSPEDKEKERIAQIYYQIADEKLIRFTFEAAAFFASLLDGVKSVSFLDKLYNQCQELSPYFDDQLIHTYDTMSKPTKIKTMRQAIIDAALFQANDYGLDHKVRHAKKPANEYAKFLQKIADTYGIKLGKAFDQAVEAMDAEIAEARHVAVETEKGKSA